MSNNDIWVFVEQEEGKIADVSLELLTKGQELARRLNSAVCGVLCGARVEELAEAVIHHGADRVLLADHPDLENYRTLPYARVASDLARERRPYTFLFGASPIGRDLAPRVASALQVGLTADCTD
ncbi:MAG: electron transfer flavoprotein subunit alpha, partial [Chloroflexota bacterium]